MTGCLAISKLSKTMSENKRKNHTLTMSLLAGEMAYSPGWVSSFSWKHGHTFGLKNTKTAPQPPFKLSP